MMLKFALAILAATTLTAARAETMTFQRVVPPGAQLTYSEGGQVVKILTPPPGRVTVTIEYETNKRGRVLRRTGE